MAGPSRTDQGTWRARRPVSVSYQAELNPTVPPGPTIVLPDVVLSAALSAALVMGGVALVAGPGGPPIYPSPPPPGRIVQAEPPRPDEGSGFASSDHTLAPFQFGSEPIFVAQTESSRPAEGWGYGTVDQTLVLSQLIAPRPIMVPAELPGTIEGWWTAFQPRVLTPSQLHAPPVIVAQAEPPRPGEGSWFMTETFPLAPSSSAASRSSWHRRSRPDPRKGQGSPRHRIRSTRCSSAGR